jgi:phospholipase C
VISPYAKKNYVDHTITDQSSVIAFIEDNWGLPRVPNSMDSIAGPITNMLDFSKKVGREHRNQLFLDPSTGTVIDDDDDHDHHDDD